MQKDQNNHYKTSDLYLAAFLYGKNFQLVTTETSDTGKCIFVFTDTPEIDDLVTEYRYGEEVMIDARKYAYAINKLKAIIHDR